MSKLTDTIDFTEGPITSKLIRFSAHMFLGAVFSLLYGMVDSAVLGRLVSVKALAAVGATTTTGMLIMHFAFALTNAVSIQTSQARGAGQPDAVRRILGSSITLSAFAGCILMLVMFPLTPLFMRLLGTPSDILEDAVLYMRITGGLYVGQLFYNLLTGVLQAIGDSSTPLFFLIFSSVLNAVLDVVFVAQFHLGVAGVAWATVISQVLSALLCMGYMLRKHPELRFTWKDMKPDGTFLRNHLHISMPMAFQGGMLAVGDLVITAVINSFGSDAVAAFTVGWKCVQLVQITYSQLSVSMTVYTGQNYGAKKIDRIRRGVRNAMLIIGSLCLISMAAMLLFGDKLMMIYLDPQTAGEGVKALLREYMNVTACFLPSLAVILTFLAILRGMGHIRPTVTSSVLELVCKIGFSLLLPRWFGTRGLWFAMPIGWVLGLIPPVWYFYFGGWEAQLREGNKD